MILAFALAAAVLFGCGAYLLLKRDLVRVVAGIMLISQCAMVTSSGPASPAARRRSGRTRARSSATRSSSLADSAVDLHGVDFNEAVAMSVEEEISMCFTATVAEARSVAR